MLCWSHLSWKTPRKEKGKIQLPQTVELSKYHKVYCYIYVYKPYDCVYATSFLLWVSILMWTITVVRVLVILGTLGSQRFSRILKETLNLESFMRIHCDTWDDSRSDRQIGVVLGNVFVQIPFPKHRFTPGTLYRKNSREKWRKWISLTGSPCWPSASANHRQTGW